MFNYRKSYAGQARLIALNYIAKLTYGLTEMRDVRVQVNGCQRNSGALQVVVRIETRDGWASPWLAIIKPDNQDRVCIVAQWERLFDDPEAFQPVPLPSNLPVNVDVL